MSRMDWVGSLRIARQELRGEIRLMASPRSVAEQHPKKSPAANDGGLSIDVR